MLLNVGCGDDRAPRPWVNVDLHTNGPKPDVCATTYELPFESKCCRQIYAGHVLEHLSLPERAAKEWSRLLEHGGWLYVVWPDGTGQNVPEQIIRGGRRWRGDEHEWLPGVAEVENLMHYAGLTVIHEPDPLVWWPVVSTEPGQLSVLARRFCL